jgi:hypothetical protein
MCYKIASTSEESPCTTFLRPKRTTYFLKATLAHLKSHTTEKPLLIQQQKQQQ